MNKKLLAVAISAALAAPMAASADVKNFGDARVRYAASSTDCDNCSEATKNDFTDSRVRWGVEATSDDGVMVKARIKASNGTHGAGPDIAKDYGYMTIPLGPVTVGGGVMVGNFGNRLTYWDTRPNRVVFSTAFGDWKAALTFDKMREAGEADEDDKSSMKLILNGKIPTGKAGLMLNSVQDHSRAVAAVPAVPADAGADPIVVGSAAVPAVDKVSDTGTETILYYAGKVGPVMLLAEYNNRGGDAFKVTQGTKDQQPSALYLHGIMNVGMVNLQLAMAQTKSFKADDHMAPFSIVGTSQQTGLMELGEMFDPTGKKVTMWNSQVIALFAGMDVMPMMHVQLGLAQYSGKVYETYDNASGTIIDLQAKYTVNKATKIVGSYATATSGDAEFGDKMKVNVMGVSMETKF